MQNTKHRIFILFFLLLPTFAQGKEKPNHLASSCPSASQIEPYIVMCGQNSYIALQARYCANSLAQEWKQAANHLVKILQPQKNTNGQNQAEEKSVKDYQETIQAIHEQIKIMQKYTATISMYPKVMIDVPGSTGDSTSLGCFNEAFHQVQDTVSFLDQEIIRAKQIRRSAESLMKTSLSLQTGFGTVGATPNYIDGKNGKSVFGKNSRAGAISGEIRKVLNSSKPSTARLDKFIRSSAKPPFISNSLDGITATFSNSSTDLFKNAAILRKSGPVTEKSVGASLWNVTDQGVVTVNVVEKTKNISEVIRSNEQAVTHSESPLSTVAAFDREKTKIDSGKLDEKKLNSGQLKEPGPFAKWMRQEKNRQLASQEVSLFTRISQTYKNQEIYRK